jgi:cytochrome c-type biogenesis protein CcmH
MITFIHNKEDYKTVHTWRSVIRQWGPVVSLLAAVCLAGLAYRVVLAQTTPTPSDDQVNAVAKQLYCPVCENTPLDVCPTTACAQWRDLIREKLMAGWNVKQINDYFATQYGDRVLAQPLRRGLNWLVYILPPVAILLGAYILYRVMRGTQRPAPSLPAEPTTAVKQSDEYLKRIETELHQREKK